MRVEHVVPNQTRHAGSIAKHQSLKVSVLMLAYNHEAYVAQAVESALMQQTDFNYEIVIGEDCSRDRTREIVIELQRRFPQKIRLLLPEQNLGMHLNFANTLKACKGQYVAILEGDDYWTSREKLQKQVDFLDAHPRYTICFHNVQAFYEDNRVSPWNLCPNDQKQTSSLKHLLVANFIPTCTVMFRHGLIEQFPDWFCGLMMIDWPLHIFNAQHGDIGYIREVMAAYRIHLGGVFSMTSVTQQHASHIEMFNNLEGYLGYEYRDHLRESIFRSQYTLAVAYAKSGDLVNARKYADLCFSNCSLTEHVSEKLKLFLRLNLPLLFRLSQSVWHSARIC